MCKDCEDPLEKDSDHLELTAQEMDDRETYLLQNRLCMWSYMYCDMKACGKPAIANCPTESHPEPWYLCAEHVEYNGEIKVYNGKLWADGTFHVHWLAIN